MCLPRRKYNQTTKTILLALFALACPSAPASSLILHKKLISIVKMIAECQQKETKILLSWQINTQSVLVQLPKDKFIAYTRQIQEVTCLQKSPNGNLESIIGRLEQDSYTVPHVRFSLNQLRHLQMKTTKQTIVSIPQSVINNLLLFVKYINHTVLRQA